jgi:hypothetical protein
MSSADTETTEPCDRRPVPPQLGGRRSCTRSGREARRCARVPHGSPPALTLLAQLRRGTAREHETLRALGDVHDGLTEGFELPQLAAARIALAERAEQSST